MKIDKITCVICGEETSEIKYPEHMAKIHSGMSQIEALQQKKEIEQNIPKPLEVPLDKEAPLPPEFEELAKLIDNPKKEEPVVNKPPDVVNKVVNPEPTPLKLKYVWEGNCKECNAPVRTVITKVDGRWFATAFCITHLEQDQREVTPLTGIPNEIKEMAEKHNEEHKDDKRVKIEGAIDMEGGAKDGKTNSKSN